MTFKDGASYIQKKYNLNIAEANEFYKGILEDVEYYKEKRWTNIEKLESYLVELEKLGA
jgi:hypothetical protein